MTVKVTGGLGDLMGAVRPLHPEKGKRNPPHLQTRLPRWLVNKIMASKKEESKCTTDM